MIAVKPSELVHVGSLIYKLGVRSQPQAVFLAEYGITPVVQQPSGRGSTCYITEADAELITKRVMSKRAPVISLEPEPLPITFVGDEPDESASGFWARWAARLRAKLGFGAFAR